jgi:hypothetical protein
MKELTMAFNGWYVIDGDEHLKFSSFSDALAVMGSRWDEDKPSKQLLMMSDKEYATWHSRKAKRGKKS